MGLALFVVVPGCSFGTGSHAGRVENPPEPYRPHVPEVADRHEFGAVGPLQAGQWTRYRVIRGTEQLELTIGVAAREGDGAWLEVVQDGDPRRASLRFVGASGTIERAFFRELPARGDPSAIESQPIVQAEPRDFGPSPSAVTTAAAKETMGGRFLTVAVVTAVFRDDELGREYKEEGAWSTDVPPIFAGGERGGLVWRRAPKSGAQLLDFGTGYVPLIPVPRS